MNLAKIEASTNIKFMVKVGWNNEDIIGTLRNVYRDNSLKKISNL